MTIWDSAAKGDTAAWRMDRRAPSGGFQDSLHEQCINIHEALLLHKADPNIAKTPSCETPLHDASSYGFPDFIQLFLDAGARTESKDSLGRTPLIAAVARGHTRAALALLKGGEPTLMLLWDQDSLLFM